VLEILEGWANGGDGLPWEDAQPGDNQEQISEEKEAS